MKNTLNGVKIKIVALGKTGSNVINKMILNNIVKADFITIDTEKLNLDSSKAPKKIFVSSITSFEAMEDLRKQTEKEFQNADMVFIIAEMGEKTGTLLSSAVAEIAKSMNILTVAIVSKPFDFEDLNKIKLAKKGKERLKHFADTIIVIPYQRLNDLYINLPMANIYEKGEKAFVTIVKGILDLIKKQGIVNLDFADIKSILQNSGKTVLGFGKADGEDRVKKAVEQALNTPLLDRSIKGAGKILMNITSGNDIRLEEISKIATAVAKSSENPDLFLAWGTVFEETKFENPEDFEQKGSCVKVYLIATDFGD
ncbi:cell division protein FtsZ [Leptotrichia sp. oral taxon 417]|jgi:cell division protein ftsZ homolog 1|uniref:cell division protein FtsZ n=1 Tax=Leptotrichia sp. oral taxon 417 TaxID=712365 RepID=UPI0015BBD017|nr:cell division protein FtsZ [Leptotrichia sp. oral taxon 417]NWO26366.1 cell division protein FtsZ [Leptotrichia sp. oral taxon 417]